MKIINRIFQFIIVCSVVCLFFGTYKAIVLLNSKDQLLIEKDSLIKSMQDKMDLMKKEYDKTQELKKQKEPKKKQSTKSSLDEIIKAICLVESDNRSNLKGKAGERGIIQIQKGEWEFTTHKLMGVDKKTHLLGEVKYSWDDAFDKNKNICVGKTYLNHLIKKYGSSEIAVKVYHSGHRGTFELGRGDHYWWMVQITMKTGNTKWRKLRNV